MTFCVGPPTPNPTSCTGNCAATIATVPIAASFTYTLGCNGCLNVTNNSVVYGNPANVTYQWNFGDPASGANNTSTLQQPGPHCFAGGGGSYTVTLTMTYNDGTISCIKTDTKTVAYTPLSISNNAPVCTNTPVIFSSNPGGFITYTWNFGDGFTGYISPIQHAYDSAASYTASLSVTDILGNICTATTSFTVLPGISSCTIQPAYLCAGSPATLVGPLGVYTYLWEVETSPGVFTLAPGTNTSSTYTTNITGNYHVVVTGVNNCKCVSNTVPVLPVPKPKASFTISPSKQLCSPGGFVILSAPNISGNNYQWYANGAYGSPIGTGATFGWPVSSTTTINLVVTNQYGCTDTCSQVITVNSTPLAPALTSTGTCAGVPVTLAVANYSSNISWSNGATSASIVVFSAGTYVATYTDPTTGCSASTPVTINRRPSAGLFPHLCDSIPCNCTRPFVVYAPNPLIGLYASNYQINWYNANTNALLATGNSFSNGGAGVQTGSYYIVITDLGSNCKDTSNTYSVVVPKCDTCDCKKSTWGEMILKPAGASPLFPKCGKTYNLECNQTYSFTSSYSCKDTSCKGKSTYSLQPPSGPATSGTGTITFTTSQSGTYILKLYGWCGDRPCDSCIIRFNVSCPCDCKGSKWDNVVLMQSTGLDDAGKAIMGLSQNLKCSKTYKLDCKKPYSLSTSFICGDPNCKGTVTYSLQLPTGSPITGTAPINFTTTQNGIYTLTLYGWCGGKLCDSCVIKFDVQCGCDCAGSKWNDIVLTQVAATDNLKATGTNSTQSLKCGKAYDLKCRQPVSVNTSFLCKDTACKGKITYSLLPPSGLPITGTNPINFTPTVSGTFTLTLYGWCGDKICDSCVVRFKVDCPPVDTPCCAYNIKIQPGTVGYAATVTGNATIANQTFNISGLTGVLLSEVRAEVLSFDISSNYENECLGCKTLPFLWASIASTGNIGVIPGLINLYGGANTASFIPTGAAVYQNPREVVWSNGSVFSIGSPVSIKFYLPPPPIIGCCELKGKICVKFTFRDMNCKECEAVSCFDVVIRK